jgi:hypothetical protein
MALPAFAKHGVTRQCCLPHDRALAQRPNGLDQPGRRACGRRSDPPCRTGRVPAPHGAVHEAERRHAATRGATHTKRNLPRALWPGART